MRSKVRIAAGLSLAACIAAVAAQGHDHAVGRNLPDVKFATIPGLPDCAQNAVLNGDPAKGPSIILGRIAAGCTVPWHWHTPNEHLMLVSGRARLEQKDGKPFTLEAGGYAMMPARHVHQFRCLSDCVMYVHSDGPFDIHYVDN